MRRWIISLFVLASADPTAVFAAIDFDRQVAPLLAARCLECHNPTDHRGDLDLTTATGLAKGGTDGAVVVAGKLQESLLWQQVSTEEMPPKKPLSNVEKAILKMWIAEGGSWGRTDPIDPYAYTTDKRSGSDFWSLRPIQKPTPPAVKDHRWVRNEIDCFVLAKLEAKGLKPNPPADPRTLVRRVYFDLIGLPPMPEEVEAFVQECTGAGASDAYSRLIDRLLASSLYGERWARHWLDVVRYTESQGFEYDRFRPHAWHYRDYVINSFNEDKPYHVFMQEQIAGDVKNFASPSAQVDSTGVIATSLLVCGPWDEAGHKQANATQRMLTREEEQDDLISVVGQTFLGLTVNCARCHNHKFDPIPQVDYYRIKSVFDGVQHGERLMKPGAESKKQSEQITEWEQAIRTAKRTVAKIEAEARKQVTQQADNVEAIVAGPLAAAGVAKAQRTVKSDATEAVVSHEQMLEALTVEQRRIRDAAFKLIASTQAELSTGVSYTGLREQPQPTHRLQRGDVHSPTEVVAPGALSAIKSVSCDFGLAPDAPEAQRRAKFAAWLADPANPLPARVMANRLWHYHFGRGIVETLNDFGFAGVRPTHPELLDWLAAEFMRGEPAGTSQSAPRTSGGTKRHQAWSVKRLHKLILMSSTYRQGSSLNPAAAAVDADNALLWRYAPRRVEGEVIRDAMLAVAGNLNPQLGGPSFRPFTVTNHGSDFYHLIDKDTPEFNRRSIYRAHVNSGKSPLLDSLDCPDPAVKVPARRVTTTPLAALALMNDSFVQRQVDTFAARVVKETNNDMALAIVRAFQYAFGRSPTATESRMAANLAQDQGLPQVCWVLMNATEFLYVK